MSNRAWVTLATNDSYGLGALVLAHSLRRVSSEYPAVVLITPSVTDSMRDRLRAVFAEVIVVDVLDSGDAAHLALLQRPELGITFTKIHCWNLTQYEKCVFLDADTLVVQNCDELFEREQLSAAPDVGWPDCFNSGVFVFTPSAETFSQLIAFAQERGSFDGGDQGLLNSFFSDWARGDINKHLPFLYNVTSAAFYSYLPALKQFGQDLKIIHFIGAAKPWLQQYNFESGTIDAPEHIRGLLQLWWDLFVSQVHCQLETGMVEVEESPEVQTMPPDDVIQDYHYQPILDPQSEFPWHRPQRQNREEPHEKQIDPTEFFDPWDIYKGRIPANPDDHVKNDSVFTRIENHEEIRNYAWNYQAQEFNQQHDRNHNTNSTWENQPKTQIHQNNYHWGDSFQQHVNPSRPIDHDFRQFSTQENNETDDWLQYSQQHNSWSNNWQQNVQQENNETDHHWQHDSNQNQTYNSETNWSQYLTLNNTEPLQHTTENNSTHNNDNIWQYHQQQNQSNHHWLNYPQHDNQSFPTNNNMKLNAHQNYNQANDHWQQRHDNHKSDSDCNANQVNSQQHNNQTHDNNILYNHVNRPDPANDGDHLNCHSSDHQTHSQYHGEDHQYDNSSHTNQFNTNNFANNQNHCEESEHTPKSTHTDTQDIAVHHIQVEKTKKRNRHKRRLLPIDLPNYRNLNGDVSENESDSSEEIIPRHPYDGFYIRHRVTIDSRGRKICSHEIPPTPSISPPPESPTLENGFNDDEDAYLSTDNFDVQSGVAGNLARVLPGAEGQHEALDELTRRQGWEAGNIDYMGADSFDNIWAKISQTLSKPRTSPPKQQSPPKEVTPPQPASEKVEVQASEAVREPVVELVDVAKEAVPVESAAPIETAAPVEVVESAAVSASVAESVLPPLQVTSSVIEPPTQADIQSKQTIPVEIPTVVEEVAQVETAPIEVTTSSKATEPTRPPTEVTQDEIAVCPAKTEILTEVTAVASEEISAPSVVPETVDAVTLGEISMPTAALEAAELVASAEISAPAAPPEAEVTVAPVAVTPIEIPPEVVEVVAPANVPPTEVLSKKEVSASVEAATSVIATPVEMPVSVESPVAIVAPAVETLASIETPATPGVLSPSSVPVTIESTECEVPSIVKEVETKASVVPEDCKKTDQSGIIDSVKVVEASEQKTPTIPGVLPPSSVPVTIESTECEVPSIVKEVETKASVVPEDYKKTDDQSGIIDSVKVVEPSEQKTEIAVQKKEETVSLAASQVAAEPRTVTTTSDVTATPSVPAATLEITPEKSKLETDSDSPPLLNTPSKEELDIIAVKSEERRKPAGKLKLVPPAAADPLPTPDSELEDDATLAQSIIASELRTPTVTSPESAASPELPLLAPTVTQSLSVKNPEVPTPPVDTVSLAQIGVKSTPKGKSTTAALIESSIETPLSEATPEALTLSPTESKEASSPSSASAPETLTSKPTPVAESSTLAPSEAPKKKIVKKVVKKEVGATGADAPVPPPRKKEKKPKEK